MISKALALALLSALPLVALGCGDGLSTDDAKLRCDQERAAKTACFTDQAYDQCVQCNEECGDKCATLESCPVQYACPAE